MAGIRYRAEVDGLRAVAVLPVMLFHAKVPGFEGGYLGVDIFLVISGYLITSLIAAEMTTGRFSIVGFYERRARRILPALLVVLGCCALAAPLAMTPLPLKDFGGSTVSVALFASNIFLWTKSGYFGTVSDETPLLHTWSLGVEEQFYIFFPLIMVAMMRFGAARLSLIVLGLALASLAFAEWGWRNAAEANFFLAPSRAMELMIGALVALAPRAALLARFSPLAKQAGALLALAFLLGSLVIFDANTPHPSLLTLVPVLATGLLILLAEGETVCGQILSSPPLVGIGLISYSVYLWHQPLFAFARILEGGELYARKTAVLILAAFVLGALSWRFIEQPFRNRAKVSARRIFAFAAAGTAASIAVGAYYAADPYFFERAFQPEVVARAQMIAEASEPENNTMVVSECHLHSESLSPAFEQAFARCAARYGSAYFITGGSHAMDFYNAMALNSSFPFIASVSRGYCRPHVFFGGRVPHRCYYEELKTFVTKNAPHIRQVIYTQTPDRLFPVSMATAKIEDISDLAVGQVIAYLTDLQETSGVGVTIVGMLPPIQEDPRRLDPRKPIEEELARSYSPALFALTEEVEALFAERAREAHLGFVSKMRAFNIQLPDDLLVDGKITYHDSRHLSRAGEQLFGARFLRYISAAGPSSLAGLAVGTEANYAATKH